MNEIESRELAILLVEHLQDLRHTALEEYIRQVYQTSIVHGLSTETIFAVEVEEANFSRGEMSSVPVRTWQIQDDSCVSIPFVEMGLFNAASDAGSLWPHPIIKFCAKCLKVLASEMIGIEQTTNGNERLLLNYRLLRIGHDGCNRMTIMEEKRWLFAS